MQAMRSLLLLILLSFYAMNGFTQNFGWSVRAGRYAYDYGTGVGTDAAGNIYMSGKYEEDSYFDNINVTCQGNHDIFLAKYNSSGVIQWVSTAGGTQGDYAHGMTSDAAGNSYLACEIEGTASFGSIVVNGNPGDNDIVIAKYDTDGNCLWAKSAGGYKNDKAIDIAVDGAGNSFITGQFQWSAFFDAITITSNGEEDMYLAKYDPDGNLLWVVKAGGTGPDEGKGVTTDNSGNSYVTGHFMGSINFGNTTLNAPNGYLDLFVVKYDPDGNVVWAKQAGGDFDDVGRAICSDDNYLYITGEFNAFATFDAHWIVTNGMADVFVACYNLNGEAQWVKGGGGNMVDRARGITVDKNRNVYFTGQFGNAANFMGNTIYSPDSMDVFVACVNMNGEGKWAISASGPADAYEPLGYEAGNAITVNNNTGKVYVAGSYLSGAIFNATTLAAYDRTDAFLAEVDESGAPSNPASLNNIGKPEVLSIYPNPANGEIRIDFNPGDNSFYTVRVINALGEVVLDKDLANALPAEILIGSDQLPAGIYLVKVEGGNNAVTKRIVRY